MNEGIAQAIRTFRMGAKTIPAYKKFLRKKNFNPSKSITQKNFSSVPLSNKKNYILKYPLLNRINPKKIPSILYASSGSSGKPTYWYSDDDQEHDGGLLHESLFRNGFNIKKRERTLVIICFSMGVWIAGHHTKASCRFLSRNGYNLTVISPGYSIDDVISALKHIAPSYNNILLAGHPQFIMDIAHEMVRLKLPALKKKIKILISGDKVSEKWRDDILSLLKIRNSYTSLFGIYGSTDAGVMGFETPLSIFLRREALKNKNLYRELFRETPTPPAIYQYKPEQIYFEEVNEEFIITKNNSVPLVRYNIRDRGSIFTYRDIKKILSKHGLEKKVKRSDLTKWSFPFIIMRGRSDVAATFYALHIYPEHVQAGLDNKRVYKYLSGSYFAYTKHVRNSKRQKFYIKLELAPKTQVNKKNSSLILDTFVKNIEKVNIEYRKLHTMIGDLALPILQFYKFGDPAFKKNMQKRGILRIKGKKTKMVI